MYLYDVLKELQVMDEMGFSKDQYCIMFDAAMVMHGIKSTCDQIIIGGYSKVTGYLMKNGYELQALDDYPFRKFYRLTDHIIIMNRRDAVIGIRHPVIQSIRVDGYKVIKPMHLVCMMKQDPTMFQNAENDIAFVTEWIESHK